MIVKIIELLFSGFAASILMLALSKLFEGRNELKRLIVILLALENECDYNSIHRGCEQSLFQTQWLQEVLLRPEFYEFCDKLVKECLEIGELAKDANLGQLNRRKIVPSNVQDKMSKIASEIKDLIPELKKKTGIFSYLIYKTGSFK